MRANFLRGRGKAALYRAADRRRVDAAKRTRLRAVGQALPGQHPGLSRYPGPAPLAHRPNPSAPLRCARRRTTHRPRETTGRTQHLGPCQLHRDRATARTLVLPGVPTPRLGQRAQESRGRLGCAPRRASPGRFGLPRRHWLLFHAQIRAVFRADAQSVRHGPRRRHRRGHRSLYRQQTARLHGGFDLLPHRHDRHLRLHQKRPRHHLHHPRQQDHGHDRAPAHPRRGRRRLGQTDLRPRHRKGRLRPSGRLVDLYRPHGPIPTRGLRRSRPQNLAPRRSQNHHR